MTEARPISDQEVEAGRVYAAALLGLAEERGKADEILDEVRDLAALVEDQPDLEVILSSPLVDVDERRALIDKIFQGRVDDLLVDTIQVMNRKGRSGLVRALAVAYLQEYRELKGVVEATARTAVPLSVEMRQRLRQVVTTITGKTVQLTEQVDESLIGGMVLRVGDAKMDTSVAKEIREMEAKLLDRAATEALGGTAWTTSD